MFPIGFCWGQISLTKKEQILLDIMTWQENVQREPEAKRQGLMMTGSRGSLGALYSVYF